MYVRTELNQLVIERDEAVAARRPIEDIGYVVVEHPQVRFSTPALQQLAASNAIVVFCGRDYMRGRVIQTNRRKIATTDFHSNHSYVEDSDIMSHKIATTDFHSNHSGVI